MLPGEEHSEQKSKCKGPEVTICLQCSPAKEKPRKQEEKQENCVTEAKWKKPTVMYGGRRHQLCL